MSIVPVSPAGSLSGFSLRTLLARRKDALKAVAGLLIAFVLVLVQPIRNEALNALVAGAVGFIGTLLGDFIDFWLTDVDLSK